MAIAHCAESIKRKNIMDIYVKKLTSLNPDEYHYIRIAEALKLYDTYLLCWIKAFKNGRLQNEDPKSFEEWLGTEI